MAGVRLDIEKPPPVLFTPLKQKGATRKTSRAVLENPLFDFQKRIGSGDPRVAGSSYYN